jgi:hypothetical protein
LTRGLRIFNTRNGSFFTLLHHFYRAFSAYLQTFDHGLYFRGSMLCSLCECSYFISINDKTALQKLDFNAESHKAKFIYLNGIELGRETFKKVASD